MAFRVGIRHEGVLMLSGGIGVLLDWMCVDYTIVSHPYLHWQHRASIAWHW